MKSYPFLSAVCHQLVVRAPSGLTAQTIADLIYKGKYATMMSELSGQPGHKLGADKLLPLMDVTGSDLPVTFLARERGGVFIKLPPCEGELAPIQQQCLVAVREFGDLISTTADSLLDNNLSRDDRSRILKEGHKAITAIMGLLKLVEE